MSIITEEKLKTYVYFYTEQGVQEALGRTFCDDFKISDPDLYREPDNSIALDIIEKRYISYF